MNVNTPNTKASFHEILFTDNQKKKHKGPKPTPPMRTSSIKSNNNANQPTTTTKIELRTSVFYPASHSLLLKAKTIDSDLSNSNDSVNSILSHHAYLKRVTEAEDLIERVNSNFYKIPSATSPETEALRMVFIEDTLKSLYEIPSLIDQSIDSRGNTFFSRDPSHDAFNKKMSILSFDYHQNEMISYDAKQAAALLKCYHKEYMESLPEKPVTTIEREALYLRPHPEWL